MRRALGVLAVRDFRWLWSGHTLFVVSLTMSRLALGWLTLELTDSAYWVGVAIGMDGAGKLIFGVFAGVLVDRFDKRAVLLISQCTFAGLCLLLGFLIVDQVVLLWSDDFNLDGCAARQGGDLHGGAGGEIAGEMLRIHLVHRGEVGEVGEENSDLHHVREAETLVIEDDLDVLQHTLGLNFDVANDELACGWIERDLAGTEE